MRRAALTAFFPLSGQVREALRRHEQNVTCAVTDIVNGRPTYLAKNNDTLRHLSEKSKLGIPLPTLFALNRELWLDIKGAPTAGSSHATRRDASELVARIVVGSGQARRR